tara:strand:+ start:2510 stop:2677 length:168 start_codon:yes stop_codon:yes gene_type:complete
MTPVTMALLPLKKREHIAFFDRVNISRRLPVEGTPLKKGDPKVSHTLLEQAQLPN